MAKGCIPSAAGWYSRIRCVLSLEQVVDKKKTGCVVSVFLLMGSFFWLIDSVLHTFIDVNNRAFLDFFLGNVPHSAFWTRVLFLLFCLLLGIMTARIFYLQKEGVVKLEKAREEAESREMFMRSLIQAIPDMVWMKDANGVHRSCNSSFESFFGKSGAELLGKTDADLFDMRLVARFQKSDLKVFTERKTIVVTEKVPSPVTGEHGLFETTKAPLFDIEGKVSGIIGISRDITEKVKLQDQLVQAQKMESIGRFAGGVAHDFNNMLSVIIGQTELLLYQLGADTGADSSLYESLKEIQDAGHKSADLTRRLLAFSRKQTIAPQILDLNSHVTDTLKMLQRLMGESVELCWSPAAELWPVLIDPSQLDQLLANLCVNARDAIANTGRVTIESDNVVFEEEYCRKHSGYLKGEYAALSITDNGCGMDQTTLNHIFEPFYTTKKSGNGTGLGLATIYGIVRQNNGFVIVDSESNRGTTFTVYLPRQAEKSLEQDVPAVAIPAVHGHETLLVVEDEPSILAMIRVMLQRLGYTVLTADSPSEALLIAQNHAGHIDLLLTDVIMPEMNGKELAAKIQICCSGLKTLFMSGYTANVISRHGVLDPEMAFIVKPFSTVELSSAIRKAIEG